MYGNLQMKNIIKFRRKLKENKSVDFLHQGNNTISFDNEKIKPSISLTNCFKQDKTEKDWSNEEIALLWRVKRLLDLAKLPNTVDRGITDEGDPWFLFCGHSEDVFIHVCRINRIYIIDSPVLEKPLKGYSFDSLVTSFVKKTTDQASHQGPQIVPIQQNGKIFLHPSAILAALIWTLLSSSKDLVFLSSPDLATLETDDLTNLDLLLDVDHCKTDTALTDLHQNSTDDKDFSQSENFADGSENKYTDIASPIRGLGAENYQKNVGPIFGVSLAVISLAMGFKSAEKLEKYSLDIAKNFMSLLMPNHYINNDEMEIYSSLDRQAHDTNFILQSFFNIISINDSNQKMYYEHDYSEAHITSQIVEAIQRILQENQLQNNVSQSVDTVSSAQTQSNLVTEKVHLDKSTETEKSEFSYTDDISSDKSLDVDLVVYFNSFGGVQMADSIYMSHIDNHSFDGVSIFASFDISSDELVKTEALIKKNEKAYTQDQNIVEPDVSDVESTSKILNKYDDFAQRFMNYLHGKDGDLEVISVQNELIFIDLDVFNVQSNETYVQSWELDNGHTISIIGLQEDYESFAMIA
jgi:hypothetical protein